MDTTSLRNLYITLILFAYCSSVRSHYLDCIESDKCLCYESDVREIQCPKNDPEISVKVSPKNRVEMQCLKDTTPFFDMEILPDLDVPEAVSFKLQFCYLNTTFDAILSKFNMTNVKYLTFETVVQRNDHSMVIDVSKEMFESMENLETLSIGFSILNLDVDFLENTPNLRQLTLSKNRLSQIENYFAPVPHLNFLDLTRNQIGSLPDGVFSDLGNLTRLFLWNNNLTGLTKTMFSGLHNLQLLELSSNHITQLAEDTFSELPKLVNISLQINKIKETYSNMFKGNPLVENIRLSYNRELVLADYLFADLTSLKTVELSDDNLEEIPENLFRNCDSLWYVTLKKNRLTTIPDNTFKGLSRLKKLNLADNMLTSLSAQVFFSVERLEELYLSNNRLRSLGGNVFRKLAKLKVLDLSRNDIVSIDLLAFRGLQESLTHLDLSYNRWNDISNPRIDATPLDDCLNVEELNLNHNQIAHFPNIVPLLKLKKLDLSFNLIEELLVNQFTKSNLFTIEINLTANKIKVVNFNLAEKIAALNADSYDAAHYDGYSTVITLNNNPIICDCSNYDLIRYNDDEMEVIKTLVEFKQDKLTCSNSNTTFVKDLKPHHIDCPVLQGCPKPCSCSYKPYNTAVTVDCSFNNLTSYPQFNFNTTSHQQTILNLSGNHLEYGPKEDLNYENVTYLDLSRNRIDNISWIPPHIKELHLDENNLKGFSRKIINILKTSTSLERLYLKDNSWDCGCDALDFQKYLMEYYRKVNSSEVYCHELRIQLVKVLDLCKVSPYLTVLLPIALTVLLCFAVAFALYYRYQTEIKIYMYAKNLCLWFVTEEELDKDKTYDVFISYSHQDERFVVEHLLAELEHGETQYKVCVHVRDWIPGEFITKQVVSSVKDSRRTLVVLSNNFVDSVWGKLEFRTAHTEALTEGRARVIVVIYGDLDEDKLDDELKSYLKTNTYVKWGDKYFWNKLKYALPHSKNNFLERNRKQAKIMLKIDDKFDLIKNPPSPAYTSTPPITLDPSFLEKNQIKIDIPIKMEGENPLLMRQS